MLLRPPFSVDTVSPDTTEHRDSPWVNPKDLNCMPKKRGLSQKGPDRPQSSQWSDTYPIRHRPSRSVSVCSRQPSLFGLKQGPTLFIRMDPRPMNGSKIPSSDAEKNRDTQSCESWISLGPYGVHDLPAPIRSKRGKYELVECASRSSRNFSSVICHLSCFCSFCESLFQNVVNVAAIALPPIPLSCSGCR